jgi:hypothetical protein
MSLLLRQLTGQADIDIANATILYISPFDRIALPPAEILRPLAAAILMPDEIRYAIIAISDARDVLMTLR